nr:ankyrin repeat-containing protein bda1 [Quercus suber]
MEERIQRLNGIAQQGDIDAFYNIIQEDGKLLKHIDEFQFVDTPLHISASAGHFLFFCEMMILQPSFVNKRNPDGYTPIYLALLNGHIEIVHQLLQHDANLVYVAGREGMTPLHYAATTNDLALLDNFLSVCPNSIKYVTIRNETALHIALKCDKLEALKFLVGWLLRKSSCLRKILGQKDVKGNTVLHIAIMDWPSDLVPANEMIDYGY